MMSLACLPCRSRNIAYQSVGTMGNLANIRHRLMGGWRRLSGAHEDARSDGPVLERWMPREDAAAVRPWSSFTNVQGITAWSKSLATTVMSHSSQSEWDITGYGVLFEHGDILRAARICRRIAKDAGMQYVAVPAEDLAEFPFGDRVALAKYAPLLVFLEPGAWSAAMEDVDEATQEIQSRIANCLLHFDPEHPVVLASVATELEGFAKPLRHVGLFDRYFSLPSAAPGEVGSNFLELIGEAHCTDTLRAQIEKVGHFINAEYGERSQQKLAALALRRLAVEQGKLIDFMDLMRVCFSGNARVEISESDRADDLAQTACHEAGHALLIYVLTEGKNIPEYTSILPGRNFKGLVVESYLYSSTVGKRMNFGDFIAKVRIGLGGRAAEEIVYGPACVTSGSENDLANATRLAKWAFTEWGYCPGMTRSDGETGANLLVLGDKPSQAYIADIENQIRGFLEDEYRNTLEILRQHRPLLESITQRLRQDQYVCQEDMALLCDNFPTYSKAQLTQPVLT